MYIFLCLSFVASFSQNYVLLYGQYIWCGWQMQQKMQKCWLWTRQVRSAPTTVPAGHRLHGWIDPHETSTKKKASFRSIDSICMLPFYCSNLSARTPSICIFSFFKLKIYIQLNQEAWAAAPIFSHLAPLMRFWKLSWTPVHPKTQTDGGKEGTHLYFDGYIYMGQCKIKRKKQPCGI